MATLQDRQRDAGAEWMPFGPPLQTPDGPRQVQVAEHFDAYEAEYAAIRRYVGILHLPQRGLLEVRGADAKGFLHRMLTAEVHALTGGASVRAFQLDARGHILADVVLHLGDASTWLDTDVFDVAPLQALLEARLFGEDVTLTDLSASRECFALLGPGASALLDAVATGDPDTPHPGARPGTHQVVRLDGVACTAYRWDDAGGLGLRLWVPAEHAGVIYARLLDAAGYERLPAQAGPQGDASRPAPTPPTEPAAPGSGPPSADQAAAFAERRRASLRGRPVGWLAYNTARIEAGTPLYHIDFGPDSLPAESGVLEQAVSFTKGCYLGQEAVARMKALGHPKKRVVGLKLPGDALPVAGAQVFDAGDPGRVIGAVTSSTCSPLRGYQGIALAMARWGRHEPGTSVRVAAEGQMVEAVVASLDSLAEPTG